MELRLESASLRQALVKASQLLADQLNRFWWVPPPRKTRVSRW